MKVFFTAFVISFSLILGSYYLIIDYQKPVPEEIIVVQNTQPAVSAHTDKTPWNDQQNKIPALTADVAKTLQRAKPAKAPTTMPARGRRIATRRSPTVDSEKNIPEPPLKVVIKDVGAFSDLQARQYILTHKSFLDAIAADDFEAVDLFLRCGMKTEFATNYEFKVPENSPYLFYASETSMLYNPISLAIVAEANKSLPTILDHTVNFDSLNELTSSHYPNAKERSSFDLLALAIRTDNVELLRTLLKAGLRPSEQIYLVLAIHGANKRKSEKAKSPEELQKFLNTKAEIMIELINSGQRIEQRIPVPIPVPTPIELFFMIADNEIEENMISRIKDPEVRKKLQAVSEKIAANTRHKKLTE